MFFCVVILVLPLEKWRKNSRDSRDSQDTVSTWMWYLETRELKVTLRQ